MFKEPVRRVDPGLLRLFVGMCVLYDRVAQQSILKFLSRFRFDSLCLAQV
jgi:hypothetical protein